jgi:hypothetical protein
MNKMICVTCGEVLEDRYSCPNGHDHMVLTIQTVSDIVNDYKHFLEKEYKQVTEDLGGYFDD